MARRGGIFNRIVRTVRTAIGIPPRRKSESEYHKRKRLNPQGKLTKQQRAQLPRQPPAPRTGRDRQRARDRDPYLREWDTRARGRVGYLEHRALIDDMAQEYNLDADDKRELWDDYLRYIVGRRGVRPEYRRNDLRNPFWTKWGIDPDNFDWYEWREAMGYSHGNRR